ncbi:hypothetical protein D3C77_582440 [compost metagenome]
MNKIDHILLFPYFLRFLSQMLHSGLLPAGLRLFIHIVLKPAQQARQILRIKRILEQIILHIQSHRLLRKLKFTMTGQYGDSHIGLQLLKPRRQLQTVHPWHSYIRNQNIRHLLLRMLPGAPAILMSAHQT